MTTTNGCAFFTYDYDDPTGSYVKSRPWSWSGSCVNGFTQGVGVLSYPEEATMSYMENGQLVQKSYPITQGLRGNMVGGYFDGRVDYLTDGKMVADYMYTTYRMGCGDAAQFAYCIPYAPGPAVRPEPAFAAPSPSTPPPNTAPPIQQADGGDLFQRCISVEQYPPTGGIEDIWAMRNTCNQKLIVRFCFRANVEAAGDPNLCSRREMRTQEISAGGAYDFPFTPVREGSAMSNGTIAGPNGLSVAGYACSGGRFPDAYFDNGQFLSRGC